jgi:hypothetical protein
MVANASNAIKSHSSEIATAALAADPFDAL